MKKGIKSIIVAISALVLVVFFGCALMQNAVTPAYIEPLAINYADVNVPTLLPYTSLLDAKMVNAKMDYVHLVNSMSEDLKYNFLKGLTGLHIEAAEAFQQKVFSPEGPIGLLFPTLLGGTLGAFLIKRPGDKSKKELEKENSK